MFLAGIDDARFEGDASAGDILTLHSEVVRLRTKMGWFRARADVRGVRVAEMTMLAAIQLG
jgi:3-hydroxymyristoyl/3-hydroxydecanoyl-(acyl carrier protein) dehydratase